MSIRMRRLRKFISGAFNWLEHNLELFDPYMDGTKPDMFRNKAILELAFMCMYYHRCMKENCDPRIRKFVLFVHDVWQRPDYHERIERNPAEFRLYALTYIALLHCGIGDRSYSEIIQRILDQGYVTAVEDVPFRKIDLRHMLDCGGFKHDLSPYDQLYQQTLLAKTPSLLYLTNYDVYCITHTLFYLADLGYRPIKAIPERKLPKIRWMVGSLLGMYLRLENWDLVAELLLSCRCLRWSPPFIFDTAWNALLDAQLPDGSVPGPTFSKEKMEQLNESEQRIYYFKQNYHTTLAAALACFLSDRWIKNLWSCQRDNDASCEVG